MALTATERKRRQRERQRALDIKPFRMDLTKVERQAVAEAAQARGYEDQTEYLLKMVYQDRDKSRKENVCKYPECNCPFDMGPDGLCLKGLPRDAGVAV